MERPGWTECPRERHISVTDGEKYVYFIGSSYKTANKAVERYDCETNRVERMADLATEYHPTHSACFVKANWIYLLQTDIIYRVDVSTLQN